MLKKAQRSNDPARLIVIVTNYMSGPSFSYCALHFKGDEVFGSTKQPVDCRPCVENDFHHPDYVNLFCP